MKILVVIDKSEEAQTALKYTCNLMKHFTATVDALYVKPDLAQIVAESTYAPFTTRADVEKDIETEAEKVIDSILGTCDLCAGTKLRCKPLVTEGEPTDEILAWANEGEYDMIVLGFHRNSFLQGIVLGGVHAKILQQATQPVLILRNSRLCRKILMACRGSLGDEGAIKYLTRLFAEGKPPLTIMQVEEPAIGASRLISRNKRLSGEEILQESGYPYVCKQLKGDFMEEVLKVMATERYDLLVLLAHEDESPRSLKGLSSEVLDLVRFTSRPVLVYRSAASDGS